MNIHTSEEEFLSAENTPSGSRKAPKEFWLTGARSKRKAAIQCNKKLREVQQKENLRETLRVHQTEESFKITSAESSLRDAEQFYDEVLSCNDELDSCDDDSMEWDPDKNLTSPSFLNVAFNEPADQYPQVVEPGRVYNFDNLPVLPPQVTSPSRPTDPRHSTPKPPKQKRSLLSKLKRPFKKH